MEYQNASPQPSDSLMRLWQYRKWVAIGFFFLVFVPGMVFLWTLPQIYEATATLSISKTGDTNQGDGSSAFAEVRQRVLSRQNLSAIISQMNLFPNKRPDQTKASLAGALRHDITISPQRTKGPGMGDIYAVNVSYRDWQPQTAAAVANRLAASFRTTAGKMQANHAQQTAKALSAQIADVGKKLDKQRARINAYQKSHLGALPQQQQVQLAAMSRLVGHLQSDQTSELLAMNRRDLLLNQSAKSGGGSLAQLKQRLQNLRTTYTDQYPEVKQLKRKIAALEAQKGTGDPTTHGSSSPGELAQVNGALSSIREDEKLTRKKIAQYQQQLKRLPVTSQQLRALSQGYAETSGVYSKLLTQYEQARLTAATMHTGGPSYQVLEAATGFGEPVGPRRVRYAIVLFILSLFVGAAAAYIAEKRDTTFHSLEELRAFTSVPVLATVPYIRDGKWHPLRALRSKGAAASVVAGVFLISIGVYVYVAAYGGQAAALILTKHGG